MIPSFPKFKKLEITDKKDVEKITSRYPPSSDYNLLGLWSYNVSNDIFISKLHGNLVIQSRHYLTDTPFFSFLGDKKFVKTIEILTHHAKKNSITQTLQLITEDTVKSLPSSSRIVISEDRDNFDYIYSLEELSLLQGSKWKKKRNLVNRFKLKYTSYVPVTIDLTNTDLLQELITVFKIWGKNKNKSEKEIKHELVAFQRLLDDAHNFSVRCYGIRYKNTLIGFVIVELLHDIYTICHFTKGNIQYEGIYEIIFHEMAKALHKEGYIYFNREQDLGIPGLRMAKTDWNPVKFIKKYQIIPNR